MKPRIYKLQRFGYRMPRVCPFCLVNVSIGFTKQGTLGCLFCQAKVDEAIKKQFGIVATR